MATTTVPPANAPTQQAPTQAPTQQAPTAPTQQAAPTQLAVPPILSRATYPAGTPPLGRAPKLLGHTPQSINEIMFPGFLPGTLFTGPVLSGATPGVAGAVGAARMTMALQVDGSMGNFNLPIQFSGGAFLLQLNGILLAGGSSAVIGIGSQSGMNDIGTVPIPASVTATIAPVTPAVQLPLWSAVAPVSPFQCWIGVSTNTPASGGIILALIDYIRVAGPWSGPAK